MQTDRGYQEILNAAAEGNLALLEQILDSEWEVDGFYANRTLLHTAVVHNQMDVVQMLLEHGADVRVSEKRTDKNALHLAAGSKSLRFRHSKSRIELTTNLGHIPHDGAFANTSRCTGDTRQHIWIHSTSFRCTE
jgi:ankyrin repeat protein